MNASTPSVETILAHAVEIAEPEPRQAFVEQVCGGDRALQGRVERLIANHFQAGSFLERPAVALDAERTAGWDATESTDIVGTVIGPYKLLEQIGEGGMGLVFVAEQQEPIKRRVALKIIKPGMDSRQVIARFEAERQALALMDHPNIAKVHDGGTTSEGRPYFVMELVKGTPITDYCDMHRLSTRQRLELFLDVCHAVQHAHQKGIIHRDLKPSNVLVEIHDVHPVVKVIDFGIAKATGVQLTDKTLYTGVAQLVGTPLYMSPEQAGLSSLDVDTRSDVYSLGVVLYELLTGTTPFYNYALQMAGYDEMRRIIREEEPPRPSTRLSTMGQAALSTIAARRGLEPRRLSQQLRGELDWIVMKALEKDRNRRYQSTGAFAADVQRYLDDEPVQACPPSQLYRLGKFARRHKMGLGVAALLLAALLLGGRSWLWWVQKCAGAEGEARVAIQEAVEHLEAERWSEALSAARRAEGVLAGVSGDPGMRMHAQVLIVDLEMARRLQEVQLGMASVKDGTFDWETGAAAYADAFRKYGIDVDELDPLVAVERIQARSIHTLLVAALDDWAVVLSAGNVGGWQQKLAIARAADPDPWRNRLRDALEGKDSKAVEELAAADVPGEWPVQTLALLGKVASRTPSSERVFLLLARAQQQRPGDFWINQSLVWIIKGSRLQHLEEEIRFASIAVALLPQSPGTHLNLGNALRKKGRLDEAIAEFREAIRLKRDYAEAYNNLGNALREKGQLDEAIDELREAIRIKKNDALARYSLGMALQAKGQLNEAIDEYREAIRIKKAYAEAHCRLGIALGDKGQLDDAIVEFREAIRINKDDAWTHNCLGAALENKGELDESLAELRKAIFLKNDYAEAHGNLGVVLQAKGQLDEAIAEYREAIRLKEEYADAHHDLGRALSKKGRADEAIVEYRKALRLKKDDFSVRNDLGLALERKGQLDEAIAEYREAIRLKPDCAQAHHNLGCALRSKGQLDKAIAEYREAIRIKNDYAAAHNNLGLALRDKGQLDQGIAAFREAIRLKKNNALVHYNLGLALQAKGQHDDAIAEFHEAIQFKKDYAKAYNKLGNSLRHKGQRDEAIAQYQHAIRLQKDYAEAHYNLGIAFWDKGRLEEAIAEYHQTIRINKGYAPAHNSLAWLLATCPDLKLRDAAKAVAHAKKAVELAPGNGAMWNTLGVALYRNGDWKAAVAALMQSTQLRKGGDSTDFFFLALAHWQLNEKDKARAWYDRAVAWMDKHKPENAELKRFRAEATALLGLAKAAEAQKKGP